MGVHALGLIYNIIIIRSLCCHYQCLYIYIYIYTVCTLQCYIREWSDDLCIACICIYIYIGTCFFSGGPRVPWQFGIHNTDVFYLHAAAAAGPHKCSFIYYTFVYNTQYIVYKCYNMNEGAKVLRPFCIYILFNISIRRRW